MGKKVLFIITKGEIGGAQQSVSYLAQELVRRGIDVTIAHGGGDFLTHKNEMSAISLIKFHYLKRTIGLWTNLFLIYEVKKYIEHNTIDVLHLNSSNTLFCAIAGKLAKCKPKIIFTFRGMSLLDKRYTTSKLKKIIILFVFKILLRFTDHQVYVSQENYVHGKSLGLSGEASVIYNGLPNLQYHPKEDARSFIQRNSPIPLEGKIIIGSIGRLAYQKNYDFLIKQITVIKQQYSDILLFIIGTGPEKNACTNLIHNLKLTDTVFLLDELPDAYRIMRAFDIFVLTSRYEGMSITLLEALQAGIPILASDVGGNHETLGKAGLLFPLEQPEIFRKHLTSLLDSVTLRQRYQQRAKQQFTNFSITSTVDKYYQLYFS